MEALLKKELGTSTLKSYGLGGGGCINSGVGYETDIEKIFVKINNKGGARLMFDGEYASLDAINKTGAVQAPVAKMVLDHPDGGAMLVTNYVDMGSLGRQAGDLGRQLARMHKHNEELLSKSEKSSSSVHGDQGGEGVTRFGFHVPTCCGYIPQDNTWNEDWVNFYARNKLGQQLELIEKKSGDREARELWPQLQRVLPKFFEGITIVPALVHGDLWSGNASANSQGPVIYDPASFYGHNEYDFGIVQMFGGFGSSFFNAYHEVYPKKPKLRDRMLLYELFHQLNHWNHFGGGYRSGALSTMKQLIKSYSS